MGYFNEKEKIRRFPAIKSIKTLKILQKILDFFLNICYTIKVWHYTHFLIFPVLPEWFRKKKREMEETKNKEE